MGEEAVELDQTFKVVDVNAVSKAVRTSDDLQLSDMLTYEGWRESWDTEPLKEGESLWLKFSLDHDEPIANRFTLTLSNPAIDYLDLYALDGMNRIVYSFKVGAERDINQRPYNHRHFLLPMHLTPGQKLEIYIRIKDDGPMAFSMNLWRASTLIAEEQLRLAILGVIGGALAIMFCYFLITYVLLHSPIRFWFAVSCGLFLILFLNIQGIAAQFTGITRFIPQTSTLLISALLLTAAKVSHGMLQGVPGYWRSVSYVISAMLVFCAIALDAYWQIITVVGFAGAAVLLQLLLALLFHNRTNSMPNRVYAIGWCVISASALVNVSLHLMGFIPSTNIDLLLTFLMLGGILLIAVAIEAHEQVLAESQHQRQRDAISNLRQFYNMFHNAAEGLYTSTLDGKLLSTNPAMCKLFGYQDEQQMLELVTDTACFYANQEDRELLLGELIKDGSVMGKEIKGVRYDSGEFWFSISVQMREEDGQKLLYGSIIDVTEKKQSSISLEYLATHDSLTGIYNRREFEKRLREGLKNAQQNNSELTLLYMDLDQFKVVNDTCGHKAGDVLIKQLSQQLNDVVLNKGMLARLGGDEFGVLLEQEYAQSAVVTANKLLNVVQDFRFIWENRIFTLGVSIGLVNWKSYVRTPEQLLSMADVACYMAKEQGRNQIHTYSEEDEKMQRYESELTWVTHINDALQENKFELFYQHYHPLTKPADGYHYEILIRMRGEDGEIVPPASFLPAAERYNLTAQIDRWVIENYFKWLSENPEHNQNLKRCNINLSGNSLADKDLKLYILNAFEKYNVPYTKICFEITESMAIVKMDETLRFIETFHQLGCTFALDDFGSGFSSYAYLKSLPVNLVKIDGSFVKDLLVDNIDMAMVCSIKDIAKAMGMETVAEFVESKEIMVELGKIGVDYAQGYGVAKPAPLVEFQSYGQ